MIKIIKFAYAMVFLIFLFLLITDASKPFLLFIFKFLFDFIHNHSTLFNIFFFYITAGECISFLDCLHLPCRPTETQLCVEKKCICRGLSVKSKNNSITSKPIILFTFHSELYNSCGFSCTLNYISLTF